MVKTIKERINDHFKKYKDSKSKTKRPRLNLDGKNVDIMGIVRGKLFEMDGKFYPVFNSSGTLSRARKSKDFKKYEKALKENPSKEQYIKIATEVDKKLTQEVASNLYDLANNKDMKINPMTTPFKTPAKPIRSMKDIVEKVGKGLTTTLDYFFGTNVQKMRDDMEKVADLKDVISNIESTMTEEEFNYEMEEFKKEKPEIVKKILEIDPNGKLMKKTIIDYLKKAQAGEDQKTITFKEYTKLYNEAGEKYLTEVAKLELPTMVDSAKALGKIAGEKIKEKAKKIMEDGIKVGIATAPLVKFYNDVAGISLRQAQTRYENYDMSLLPEQGAKLGVDALKAGTALASGMIPTVAMAVKAGQDSGRKLRGAKDDLEVVDLDSGKKQDPETGETIEEPDPTPAPSPPPSEPPSQPPSEPPKEPVGPSPEEIARGEAERARDKAGDVQEEEAMREELERDFIPDVSKFGHTMAVQNIFTRYNKDFTYFKNLVANSELKPSNDKKVRKMQVDRIIAEYSSLLPIEKVNSDYTYEECLEIVALKFTYIQNVRFENSWKRSLINFNMPNNNNIGNMQRALIVQQPMGTLGQMGVGQMPNKDAPKEEPKPPIRSKQASASGKVPPREHNIVAKPQMIKPKNTPKKQKIFNDRPMILNIRKRRIPDKLLYTNLKHQPNQQNMQQPGNLPVMRVKDRVKKNRFKL
jgi:hypothetical protein